MKKLLIIVFIVIVLSVIAVGGWAFISKRKATENKRTYEFVEVKRGTIENVISGTGTLNPIGIVEVGTQVSGTIDRVYANFNDIVRKGQVLAVLDTVFLATSVRDAEAKLLQAQAQYDQAVVDLQRNEELYAQNFITKSELEKSKINVLSAKSSLLSAKSALDRAKINLNYAVIRSPIDGIVINRNIERGQTVAASFSTPTLFSIAQSLSKMEIMGLVDESDIGSIKVGQNVRFTVGAYPDKTFHGKVREIRLQPKTVSNVVNYTVVVDADNKDGLLYPGMTATLEFIAEKVENVLIIPNKVFGFKATDEMIAEFRKQREERMKSLPDSLKNRRPQGDNNQPGGFANRRLPDDVAQLWLVDDKGNLQTTFVRKGVTDGISTEIIQMKRERRNPAFAPVEITEGMKIISGITKIEPKNNSKNKKSAIPTGPTPPRR